MFQPGQSGNPDGRPRPGESSRQLFHTAQAGASRISAGICHLAEVIVWAG
ncbi:MAG: DUF5681 domain-containing protein [Deltaproteobacteria bacterium]|nr:DUF5681 domain-containing protein [Deltaproteobacteria bacterium]